MVDENYLAFFLFVEIRLGDHATNMPASIYFGEVSAFPCVIKKSLKYAYDKMGNIEKIYKNGELSVRYTYDIVVAKGIQKKCAFFICFFVY